MSVARGMSKFKTGLQNLRSGRWEKGMKWKGWAGLGIQSSENGSKGYG